MERSDPDPAVSRRLPRLDTPCRDCCSKLILLPPQPTANDQLSTLCRCKILPYSRAHPPLRRRRRLEHGLPQRAGPGAHLPGQAASVRDAVQAARCDGVALARERLLVGAAESAGAVRAGIRRHGDEEIPGACGPICAHRSRCAGGEGADATAGSGVEEGYGAGWCSGGPVGAAWVWVWGAGWARGAVCLFLSGGFCAGG